MKFERRLAQLERQLSERLRRKMLAGCICRATTVANSREPEKFEEEMNLPCPAHEFRSLGSLFDIHCEAETPEQEADNLKFERLLEEYAGRPHRFRSSELKA
jgi:hypothetical protein